MTSPKNHYIIVISSSAYGSSRSKGQKILTIATITAGTLIFFIASAYSICRIGSICSIGSIGSIKISPPAKSREAGSGFAGQDPAPRDTPLPIAPGKQVYFIRSDSSSAGPAISEATFDPLDVAQGSKVTVTVKAKDASTLTVTIIDDSGPTDYALTSSPTGIWSSSWKAESTHNRIYAATILARNTKGEERKVELWFR